MNETISNCLLCESGSLKKLAGYERDFLVKCLSCSFVFASNIPSIQELNDCYAKYPRANEISPITVKRYKENMTIFSSYRSTGRILDVGAGEGWFLKEAKDQGWDVYGTEFEDRAVELCREKGIKMHSGVLDPNNYSPASFDVITSFEVVEHISNPLEEFSHFIRLLRPGGIVYVTTPNFNSLSRILLGSSWNVINYPEHLSYYTPKTLSFAFEKAGFRNVSIETSGISLDRIKQSFIRPHAKKEQSPPGQKSDPAIDERLRYFTETGRFGPALKHTSNLILRSFNKGDTIKAIFQK